MRFINIFFYALVLFIFLNGCQKEDYSKTPPKMHWDRDLCERCKMAISERDFAVIAVDKNNKIYKFDDIGCFILWQKQEHPEIYIKKIWIKDKKSKTWIDGLSAVYVNGYKTPMDYGFAAFSKKNAPKDKKHYSFIEVKEIVISKNR